MRNKIVFLFIFILILLFFFVRLVFAQIDTASPSSAIEEKEIKSFKEKIASKVAELQKKDQKPVTGIVISSSDKQLKIRTDNDEEYQIKIDEVLTKTYRIFSSQKKEIDSSEIKKDDYLIVSGPLIDKTINANFIYIDEKFLVKVGKVTEINKTDYSIKILSSEKEEIILDIETTTKQQIIDIKTLVVEKAGFSKIKEGDTLHFVIKQLPSKGKTNRYSAIKTLIIPQEYFLK